LLITNCVGLWVSTPSIITEDRVETYLSYFMAVIDSVFCLDERVIYKRETLSVVTLQWSEIMSIYNTPDNIVRDINSVMKYAMFRS